jgi:hypothetical protein
VFTPNASAILAGTNARLEFDRFAPPEARSNKKPRQNGAQSPSADRANRFITKWKRDRISLLPPQNPFEFHPVV